jgi:hypothetical protein
MHALARDLRAHVPSLKAHLLPQHSAKPRWASRQLEHALDDALGDLARAEGSPPPALLRGVAERFAPPAARLPSALLAGHLLGAAAAARGAPELLHALSPLYTELLRALLERGGDHWSPALGAGGGGAPEAGGSGGGSGESWGERDYDYAWHRRAAAKAAAEAAEVAAAPAGERAAPAPPPPPPLPLVFSSAAGAGAAGDAAGGCAAAPALLCPAVLLALPALAPAPGWSPPPELSALTRAALPALLPRLRVEAPHFNAHQVLLGASALRRAGGGADALRAGEALAARAGALGGGADRAAAPWAERRRAARAGETLGALGAVLDGAECAGGAAWAAALEWPAAPPRGAPAAAFAAALHHLCELRRGCAAVAAAHAGAEAAGELLAAYRCAGSPPPAPILAAAARALRLPHRGEGAPPSRALARAAAELALALARVEPRWGTGGALLVPAAELPAPPPASRRVRAGEAAALRAAVADACGAASATAPDADADADAGRRGDAAAPAAGVAGACQGAEARAKAWCAALRRCVVVAGAVADVFHAPLLGAVGARGDLASARLADARERAALAFSVAAAAVAGAGSGVAVGGAARALLAALCADGAFAPARAAGAAGADAPAVARLLRCAADTEAALSSEAARVAGGGGAAALEAAPPPPRAALRGPSRVDAALRAAAAFVPPTASAEPPFSLARFSAAPALGEFALALPAARLVVAVEEEDGGGGGGEEGAGEDAVALPSALRAAHGKWRRRLVAALGWRCAAVTRGEATALAPRALARLLLQRSGGASA